MRIKAFQSVQHDFLHGQRTSKLYGSSSSQCNKASCRELVSYRPESLISIGHRSINAKEVADKLNMLLANRPAGKDNVHPSSVSSHLLRNSAPSQINATAQPVQQNAFLLSRNVCQDALQSFSWFHGDIDRAEAKFRLENDATDGAFLIRKSRKGAQTFDSPYSLSLMSSGKVYHLTIRLRPKDDTYALGFEKPDEQVYCK
jgi:SH2 domain